MKESCNECEGEPFHNCEECVDWDAMPFGFVLASPEIGVRVSVTLNPACFTQDEEKEIADMVVRTVNAFVRCRATMLMNPGLYGIKVN